MRGGLRRLEARRPPSLMDGVETTLLPNPIKLAQRSNLTEPTMNNQFMRRPDVMSKPAISLKRKPAFTHLDAGPLSGGSANTSARLPTMIGSGMSAPLLKEFIDLSYRGNTSIAPAGYSIDAPLSDSRVKVYAKNGSNDKNIVVTHRGSVGIDDWMDNASYMFRGKVKGTKTYNLHRDRHKRAVDKYGASNIIAIGHSRAGLYLQELQKEFPVKENITYNKASGFHDIGRQNAANQTDVRVGNDIVSLLAPLQRRPNRIVKIDGTKNPFDFNAAHQTAEVNKLGDQFIGKKEGSGRPKGSKNKVKEPKAEEPKAEEPKAEEPKAEEPKAEEPKAEEPKAEEPKAEKPKKQKKEKKVILVDYEKHNQETNEPYYGYFYHDGTNAYVGEDGSFGKRIKIIGTIRMGKNRFFNQYEMKVDLFPRLKTVPKNVKFYYKGRPNAVFNQWQDVDDNDSTSDDDETEEPKAEEPKAEEPKAEEPKAEKPKAKKPKKEKEPTPKEIASFEATIKLLSALYMKNYRYQQTYEFKKKKFAEREKATNADQDLEATIIKIMKTVLKHQLKQNYFEGPDNEKYTFKAPDARRLLIFDKNGNELTKDQGRLRLNDSVTNYDRLLLAIKVLSKFDVGYKTGADLSTEELEELLPDLNNQKVGGMYQLGNRIATGSGTLPVISSVEGIKRLIATEQARLRKIKKGYSYESPTMTKEKLEEKVARLKERLKSAKGSKEGHADVSYFIPKSIKWLKIMASETRVGSDAYNRLLLEAIKKLLDELSGKKQTPATKKKTATLEEDRDKLEKLLSPKTNKKGYSKETADANKPAPVIIPPSSLTNERASIRAAVNREKTYNKVIDDKQQEDFKVILRAMAPDPPKAKAQAQQQTKEELRRERAREAARRQRAKDKPSGFERAQTYNRDTRQRQVKAKQYGIPTREYSASLKRSAQIERELEKETDEEKKKVIREERNKLRAKYTYLDEIMNSDNTEANRTSAPDPPSVVESEVEPPLAGDGLYGGGNCGGGYKYIITPKTQEYYLLH